MSFDGTFVRWSGLGGALLSLGLLAASCAPLLGDVEVEPLPLQPAPSAAGSTGLPPGTPTTGLDPTPCESGEQRCRGALAELCVRIEADKPGTWVTLAECPSADQCVTDPQPHCQARACDAGESSCDGATPQVCNASQTGWDSLPTCLSAAHCSTDAGSCPTGAPCCLMAPCSAGELRCNAGEMQRCNALQTAWELVEDCATADLCLGSLAQCGRSPGACSCKPPTCELTDTRCTGVTLERCNVGRTGWDVVEPCATTALCEAGRATLGGSACVPPTCEVGSHTCTDLGVLQGCRIDRTGFDDQEPCIGAPFCNLTAGRCEDAPCESGQHRCNGAQIEVCLEDRTGFVAEGDACATAALCNESDPARVHCDPPQCAVNQFSCFQGSQLQACNEGRTGFVNAGPACPRPDLCSADRRRCDFCVPGRQECTIDLSSIRVCSLSGNFFGPETFCPLGCEGPLGTCRTCQPGTYRCNGALVERCNDGRSFTPLNRGTECSGAAQLSCNNGQLVTTNCGVNGCNVARAQCNECSGVQRRCSGAGVQQCNQQGSFGAVQGCGGGLTCRGAGNCGCDPGTPLCDDGALTECNVAGTAFVRADACGGDDGDILRVCDGADLTQVQCSSDNDCEDAAEDGDDTCD